jgi:hypothetical protein
MRAVVGLRETIMRNIAPLFDCAALSPARIAPLFDCPSHYPSERGASQKQRRDARLWAVLFSNQQREAVAFSLTTAEKFTLELVTLTASASG